MSQQRQRFQISYYKTLSVGPAEVWTLDRSGAYQFSDDVWQQKHDCKNLIQKQFLNPACNLNRWLKANSSRLNV